MIIDFINFFISSIINFISDNLLIIQIVSFLISSILLGLIIFFISKTDVFSEPFEHFFDVLGKVDMPKRRTIKGWKEIKHKLKSGKVDDLKSAILEADKILADILRMAGYPGKDLDERLEQMAPGEFSNLEELKQAHKFRGRITNEPDFTISLNEAQVIIEIYKKVFQELNLIE